MVWVAGLTAGIWGNGPILTVGGAAAQPEVSSALQVAVLIRNTLLDGGSAAYSVWVAASIAPTLAPGSGTGISAIGAQPDRSRVWQVAPLITSISGWLRLPP